MNGRDEAGALLMKWCNALENHELYFPHMTTQYIEQCNATLLEAALPLALINSQDAL